MHGADEENQFQTGTETSKKSIQAFVRDLNIYVVFIIMHIRAKRLNPLCMHCT